MDRTNEGIEVRAAQHTHDLRRAAQEAPQDSVVALVDQSRLRRECLKLALTGLLIGLAGSLALMRVMKTLLFGVSAADPLTFAASGLLLLGVSLLACWLPARRAARVDPLVSLRHE